MLGCTIHLRPISIGELTLFISYYGLTAGSLGHIVNGMPQVAAASDALQSLGDLFAAEDTERNDGRRALGRLSGDVCFERVTFRYADAARNSLDGVDLHLPPGTSLALVGGSGAGKSTVASLVLGFYEAQQGAVRIDGHDLKELDRRSLRAQVGVVSQDVVLFRASILANITWGDAEPDRARAQQAAERANAWEFISALPGGLDHELGDRGGGLSGGQRQRLAIARALYRDPRLLILDEATSALEIGRASCRERV